MNNSFKICFLTITTMVLSSIFICSCNSDDEYFSGGLHTRAEGVITQSSLEYGGTGNGLSNGSVPRYSYSKDVTGDIHFTFDVKDYDKEHDPNVKGFLPVSKTITFRGTLRVDTSYHAYLEGVTYTGDDNVSITYASSLSGSNEQFNVIFTAYLDSSTHYKPARCEYTINGSK